MLNAFVRTFTCLVFVAVFTIGGSHSSNAQNVGGLLDLFGKAVTQDIQRKQQQKQQRQYERQQQAERQRELDTKRKLQIIQIKRAQSALKRLGFYTKRIDGDAGPGTQKSIQQYVRAFRLTGFRFDEYAINTLEQHAASGFRSIDEQQAAGQGGFSNAGEMRLARKAGFTTAASWRHAQTDGFRTKHEHDEYLASGFSNSAEFSAALSRGFSRRSELEKATLAGFNNYGKYSAFLESGHGDKSSYEQALRETARVTPLL